MAVNPLKAQSDRYEKALNNAKQLSEKLIQLRTKKDANDQAVQACEDDAERILGTRNIDECRQKLTDLKESREKELAQFETDNAELGKFLEALESEITKINLTA